MYKQGDKFNACRLNGKPVTIKVNGKVTLATFTVVAHCIENGLIECEGDLRQPYEWYDCEIKWMPLPKSGTKPRYYQLFPDKFDFYRVAG